MERQLTREDIKNAKTIHLYNEDTIYVELPDTEDVYGSCKGGDWFVKGNFWDYFDSSLMLSYFQVLTPDEAIDLLDKWDAEIKEKNESLGRAIKFATEKHSGQVRKGTTIPYIVHPLEVLQILYSMRADTNVMIAGVLHDTVEDTDTTLEDIRELFGDDVASLVASNSEDKSKSWAERKQHTIDELKNTEKRVNMLIMADKLSNLRSIAYDYSQIGNKLWERFNAPMEKQAWYYSGIQDSLYDMQNYPDTENAYWEFVELFKDVFVKFYISQDRKTLYQQCATGEVYYLKKGNSCWKSTIDDITDEIARKCQEKDETPTYINPFLNIETLIPLTREIAERFEDMWVQDK